MVTPIDREDTSSISIRIKVTGEFMYVANTFLLICIVLPRPSMTDGYDHISVAHVGRCGPRGGALMWHFLLQAAQSDDSLKTAEALVLVTVEDVNDNPPVFGQTSYSASLVENAPLNAVVLRVGVTDRDQVEGSPVPLEPASHHPVTAPCPLP